MTKLSLPANLVAHAIWEPAGDTGSRLVYVSERRRRRVGVWLPPVGVALILLALFIGQESLLIGSVVVAVVLTAVSLGYAAGGAGGFYPITADGHLGDNLGRRPADLRGLRRRRITPNDLTGESMNAKVRMILALCLSAVAVGCLIIAGPHFLSEVHTAATTHATTPPKAPPLLMFGSFAGLAAWLLVIVQQWHQRQFGWMAACFLLSYVGIVSYAVTSLRRSRPVAAGAAE